MAEYWDLYDADRKPLGRTIKRGDTFAEGEFYMCCEVWMQNPEGKFLTTQRHPDKKAGGLWEFTGGGVLAGETTMQAAIRELDEELGVTAEESDLSLLAVYQHKNYFMDIYVVKKEVALTDLVLQQEEVVGAKWVSHEEILQMIEEKQMVWSVGQRYGMFCGNNYTIRLIQPKDNAQVESVIRSCLIEFGGNREGTAWCDPDLGRFSEVYAPEGRAYWVVEDKQGNVVGGSGIGPLSGDVCELQKMYLLPQVRGTGIAQQLMRLCLEFSANYYKKCYLETFSNMLAANRFYQKSGFEKMDAPYLQTEHFYCDVWYMKEL